MGLGAGDSTRMVIAKVVCSMILNYEALAESVVDHFVEAFNETFVLK